MSTYSIIPATPADLPTISSFVNISKQPLVINRLLWKDWPNEENQKAQCVRAVEGAWKDPLSETFKVIEDESGEIVGHLVLSKIEGKTAEAKGEEGSGPEGDGEKKTEENGKEGGMPEGLVPEVATAVGEATQKIGKDLEGVEHFKITHFFVSIPHRNRGIGTRLIKLCVSKAKAEGLDLAIGAEPQVHKLLLKLGFQDTVHVDFDLAQWSKDEYSGFGIFRLWGMVLKA